LCKKVDFFAHHSLFDTSAKEKKKNAQNHFEPCSSRSKKKEKRKKKEEGRKKKEKEEGTAQGSRRRSPCQISLGLAGDPRFVFVFFFSRRWVSQPHLAVALPRHLVVTHLATSRRSATKTHGWRLASRGSGFFLVL
jgi:hypothetical protein